jgi:hypothetical protein
VHVGEALDIDDALMQCVHIGDPVWKWVHRRPLGHEELTGRRVQVLLGRGIDLLAPASSELASRAENGW